MASKKNTELATKIIKQKAEVTKGDATYDFDLAHVIGHHFHVPVEVPGKKEGDTVKVTKTQATEQAIEQLADELDSGNLELSANWAKEHKLR